VKEGAAKLLKHENFINSDFYCFWRPIQGMMGVVKGEGVAADKPQESK
jgi:hypothetical protein